MMTDTLRERIVQSQAEHVEGQLTNYDTGREECGCGRQDSATYREHLADAVIAELGLREEMRYPGGTFSFTPPQRRRFGQKVSEHRVMSGFMCRCGHESWRHNSFGHCAAFLCCNRTAEWTPGRRGTEHDGVNHRAQHCTCQQFTQQGGNN